MARIRAAFKEPGMEPPVWLRDFPRLVVVGDGNTGKSTVLNRFAEFDFSAVSDGVCTRRPIKLELRATSIENHERIKKEGLEAIVTVKDYRDGDSTHGALASPEAVFVLPAQADDVRREVERLASAADRASADSMYTTDELVVRYEAPGMIHFDLVDLPGIDNDHPMTEGLVRNYINADTLDNTFMLIFQASPRGDTAMKYSICVKLIKEVQVAARQDPAHTEAWLKSHCMGTLTMYDRHLQENSPDPPATYNAKYADLLADWIRDEHPGPDGQPSRSVGHQFDWVTSLNPNSEEQIAHMSFRDASKKEMWFHQTLLESVTRQSVLRETPALSKCGIGSFRSVLVQKYEAFATKSFVTDGSGGAPEEHGQRLAVATRILLDVNQEMEKMKSEWGWEADEERYDDPECQRELLRRLVSQLLNSSNVTSETQVLARSEVKSSIKAASKPPLSGGLQTKDQLLSPVAELADFLKLQVGNAAAEKKFLRLPLMAGPVQSSITAFLDQFVNNYEMLLD